MQNASSTINRTIRSIVIGVGLGSLVAIAFFSGFFLRDLLAPSPIISQAAGEAETTDFPLLDEVQTFLDRAYYLEQPPYVERQYSAIRGLLGSLNEPNTFFIEPPVARSEADALAGTYGGIGVQVRRNELGEFELYPFDESPAQRAGILDGDVLIAVNREQLTIESQPDAVDQALRGEVRDGNGVELTIRSDGSERNVFIEFDVINVPSVIWRVTSEDNRIGYIHILRFTSRTPDEVREALRALDAQEMLILDLRNNSGGLLAESIEVAGEFLNGGIVMIEQQRDTEEVLRASNGGAATDEPLVVLVNRGTASASELVAGAIQDRERGILIGQQTFGKGTVQQIFELSDGSSVHITSAQWLTPNREPIAGVGLRPDIAMIPDENGRDVEFGEAIRTLQREQR